MKLILLALSTILFFGCTKGSRKSGSMDDVFVQVLSSEPSDLHPIRASESVMTKVVRQHPYYASSIVETLTFTDLETYEETPNLAERWEISPDQKEFTFYLRKGVKFHNGEEMTAEDVKFSFDAIFDDKYEGFATRPYLQNIKEAKVVDKYTVKFIASKVYFQNFQILGSNLWILPKSVYSKQSNENRFAKTVIGTGPYKLDKWEKGKFIMLSSFKDWWGHENEVAKKRYNFKRIMFKFVHEKTLRQAMMERGAADYDDKVIAENFVKKMNDSPWGKSVLKVKADNKVPKNLSFIGLNNKNKILKDKNVRLALAHLVNRKFINDKFYYGMNDLATGPFRIASDYNNPEVKPIEYSPEKAKKILNKAGWTDSDKDGLLDKTIGGAKVPFKFNLLNANADSEKIITVVKEDMKKAGIEMNIRTIDWTAFIKALNERKFDAVIMSWGGGGVDPDPTQIWHSKSAEGSGSNFVSYSNPEVDKLIEEGIKIQDKAERVKVFHKIHKLIAEDQPYIFYFEPKYELYAVSARVKREKDTREYSVGPQYWFLPE